MVRLVSGDAYIEVIHDPEIDAALVCRAAGPAWRTRQKTMRWVAKWVVP